MKYKVDLTISRYMNAANFTSNLAKLKAFRGEYVGPSLLESLEEHGLLLPRLRLAWPDAIARRIWLETQDHVSKLRESIESDGPRMDAAASLWSAVQEAGVRSISGNAHPLDDPKTEWLEFLQPPEQQIFVPRIERRVSISNDLHPELFDGGNVIDYYSSWQVLTAAEVADMGIHIRVNMAKDDVAKQVLHDIRNGRMPEGRATEPFSPSRSLAAFTMHEADLDAIVWSMEEQRNRTFHLLAGSGGERFVLSEEQVVARDEIRNQTADEACTRFVTASDKGSFAER